MSWSCPRCGRRFARADQFHSHETVDVDAHFVGRPELLRKSFDKLVGWLPSDVQIQALQTVVVLGAPSTFSFITVQAKRLLVGIFLDCEPQSSRFVRVDVISQRKVAAAVEVRIPSDVDDELRDWLRQAYELRAETPAPSS